MIKSLIICLSVHHRNTEKIAKAMAEVLSAEILRPDEVNITRLFEYDLIGFGSGIYFGQHHQELLNLAEQLPVLNRKAFIFSTKGIGPKSLYHRALGERLTKKGLKIIADFSCPGFDSNGFIKLFGGINKQRPNEEDLAEAKEFARKLYA
jgi:flavodoxin